jgi:Domain of unknown function (DUF4136)
MTRKHLQALAFVLLIAWAAVGCATLSVGSDYDRQASFAGYRSFTWLPRERYGTRNPLVIQRARDAIQAELLRRGYALAPDASAADFAVDFTIGSRARMDVRTYPTPYWGGWYSGPGWWGYPYWGSAIDVRQYREGTLSIDVFDARSHRPVWHGWAKKELSESDLAQSEGPIREAVQTVLAKFPPT